MAAQEDAIFSYRKGKEFVGKQKMAVEQLFLDRIRNWATEKERENKFATKS